VPGPERAREGAPGFARALRDPAADPPEGTRAHARRRLDIHRNNVVHTMVEALRATFPAVERLVGPEFFAAMARAHLAAEPPSSPLLFRYGGGLAPFIEGFAPARSVPYLADVARLEWARLQAHHAADAEPARLEALAALPPEALEGTRLALHPSLSLVRSRWPVVSLWAASTDRGDPAEVDLARGEDAAVLRPALAVETRRLPEGAAPFLAALAEGRTLAGAATEASAQQAAFDPGEHIAGLFELGAIAAIRAPGAGAPEKEGDGT
jgi:hypothetical protein